MNGKWAEWIQAISAVAIVLITFFYTLFAWKQVGEMRKATEAARKGAEAAASAAYTADMTLKNSERQFKINSRPYIVKDSMKLFARPTIGSTVKTELIIKNSGQTPALNIKVWANTLLSKKTNQSSQIKCRANALLRPGHIGEIGSNMTRPVH